VYTVALTVTDSSGLSGTSDTTATIANALPLSDGSLTGVVTSGANASGPIPVAGAHVYLFAANTAGYGQPSLSLVSATETGTSDQVGAYVETSYTGSFSLTGYYSCSSGQQLYLYVLGGNAGVGANAASGLMAAIGNCPSSSGPGTVVTVNEVSTIAAAYALAGYAVDATHVSSSGTALAKVGVANAFANAANLATLSTGVGLSQTPAGNGAVPIAEIDTLANALAGCINTGTNCGPLLGDATSDGTKNGTVPTDTATAAINIAHNPGANVTALYGLASTAVFTPTLTVAPNDWTVGLSFTGGGLNGPAGVAIDGYGDAWIANGSGNSVIELSHLGGVLSGTGGYAAGGINGPAGIAIDESGNVWIANAGNNSVSRLSNTGTPVSGSPYSGGGLNRGKNIAVDGSGNAWVANYNGNSVTEISSVGVVSPGSPITGGGLDGPLGIAIDGSNNAWIANQQNNSVSAVAASGTLESGANGYTGSGLNEPYALAIDGIGDVWVANILGNSVTELNNVGTVISRGNGYTGGGLNAPDAIAIDGASDVWIANGGAGTLGSPSGSITEVADGVVISPTAGYLDGLNAPSGIALDGSGDVWISNSGSSTVTELIGAATPVVTPIAAGLPATPTANGSSNLGTRP
jgi:hypothetical protein